MWPIKLPTGKFALPQARAENFLRVTAAAVGSYTQSQLRGVDMWVKPFPEVKAGLIGASQVVARLAAESRALSQVGRGGCVRLVCLVHVCTGRWWLLCCT